MTTMVQLQVWHKAAGALTHLGNFVEPDEDFTVSISDPQFNGVSSTPEIGFVDDDGTADAEKVVQTTIVDNDTTEVTIMKIRDGQEGDDGDALNENIINGLFEIKLSNPSQNQISVTLSDGVGNPLVDNGTASNQGIGLGNSDYQNSSLANVVFQPGDQSETASVDVIDDFIVEGTETVVATIDPTGNGITVAPDTLDPGDVTVGATNSASLDIIDDDTAMLTVDDAEVNEADGTVMVKVTLDRAVQNGFTVPYTLANGTADGGTGLPDDFNNATGMLTFVGTVGEEQFITINIFNDDVVELDETFTVGLGAIIPGLNMSVMPPVATVNPAQVEVSDTGTVTILNDDIDITLSPATVASQDEGNVAADMTEYTFTVTRTGLDTGVTTVDWTLAGSGANPASANDFEGGVLPFGTVTFPSGSANNVQTITIMLSEDTTVEGDEGFTVTLTPGSQAHTPDSMAVPDDSIDIVDGSQSATIENDDMATLTILDEQINEAAGTVTLTVAVDNAVQGGFTVGYSTSDGTATTADNDYDDSTGTVTFDGAAGETETFTVAINNDSTVEPDETFNVALGPVTGTTPTSVASDIDAGDGAVVTILNDDIDITLSPATDDSQLEGNVAADMTEYTFTVTRTGLDTGVTTVDWTLAG